MALSATPVAAQQIHVWRNINPFDHDMYPELRPCALPNPIQGGLYHWGAGLWINVQFGPNGPIGTPPYTLTFSGAGTTAPVTGLVNNPGAIATTQYGSGQIGDPIFVPTPVNNGQPLIATLSDASGVLATAPYGPPGSPVGWQTANPVTASHVSGDQTIAPGASATIQVQLHTNSPGSLGFFLWNVTWSDGFAEIVTSTTPTHLHNRQVSPSVTTTYTASTGDSGWCYPVHSGSATVTVLSAAGKSVFGAGCYAVTDAAYEHFDASTPADVGGSITYQRTNTGYEMNGTPGTFRVPPANAVVIATQNDTYGTVPLSTPMPTPNGTTSALTVCTNGFVSLSATPPSLPAALSGVPDPDAFAAFSEPTICACWSGYSLSSTFSRLVYEELNGVLYVTWEDVFPSGTGLNSTFQCQFHLPTGNCTVVYQNMDSSQARLLGCTTGNAAKADAFDLSTELANGLDIHDDGSAPLTLDSNLPVLGTNWDVTTSNIDPLSPIALTFFSTGAMAFPVDLILVGIDAPDCFVHINTLVVGTLTATNVAGSGLVTVPIPNDPSLVGGTLAAQSICLTLTNNANLLSSNGVLGTVGY